YHHKTLATGRIQQPIVLKLYTKATVKANPPEPSDPCWMWLAHTGLSTPAARRWFHFAQIGGIQTSDDRCFEPFPGPFAHRGVAGCDAQRRLGASHAFA